MTREIVLFTIGFTKKNAEQFFTTLKDARVKKVIDTRLNNVSQLAGFTKRDDLRYFLHGLHGIEYAHSQILAPTQEMLDSYKKGGADWATYESAYTKLISDRQIETIFTPELLDTACFLCSEHTAEHCHRRLAAEYLQKYIPNLVVRHLK